MGTLIALVRGVNVGGRGRLPMAELRAALTDAGFDDVRTHLQSGNVVLDSTAARDATARRIERLIAERFGLDVTVIVRTPRELAKIAGSNPFLDEQQEHAKLHVVFLAEKPSARAAAGLDPERSPPDVFVLRGRELYVHYPNGSGRSKLSLAYVERTLGVRGTARNWKTVLALNDLATA